MFVIKLSKVKEQVDNCHVSHVFAPFVVTLG